VIILENEYSIHGLDIREEENKKLINNDGATP
jgi:hypothetical protein